MSRSKVYCLGCEKTNACSCGTDEKHFTFSHQVRPPTSTVNKARFREFLRSCPIFVNMVPPELYEDFRQLLIKVGWFEKAINDTQWTFIPRKSLARKRRRNDGIKAGIRRLESDIQYVEGCILRATARLDSLKDGEDEDERIASYTEDNITLYQEELVKLRKRVAALEKKLT